MTSCNSQRIILGDDNHKYDIAINEWKNKLTNYNSQSQGICVYDVCPLLPQNMNSIWNVVKWNFSADALCSLKSSNKKINNKTVKSLINVIVFGGSMTLGRDSIGTCCKNSAKCDSSENHLQKPLDNNKWHCFWFGYISQ